MLGSEKITTQLPQGMPNSTMLRALLVLGILIAVTHGVPLRVVTFNVEANRINGNVTEALNEPGTPDYDSVRDILARVNADVVCLQEIANADISGGTNGDTNSDVHSLAAELGLPHVLIPTSSGVFDFSLRNVTLSRYPIIDSEEIGTTAYQASIGAVGEDGNLAREITRAMPAVVIAVPGAAQPVTLINLHNKAGTQLSDRFRRAVEMSRVEDYLDRNALDSFDNIIVTGDFNLSATTTFFSSEPSGLPNSWNRGSDIPLPLTFSTDPDFYFPTPYQLVAIDARDLNGGDATFQFGGATLDFFLPSPALTLVGAEIYRSELDLDNTRGLAKSGAPLANNSSRIASDHWAVFADFELSDQPASYTLTSAETTVLENFDNFNGNAAPPRWRSSSSNWQGLFSDQPSPANYAADLTGNRSLAVVPSTNAVTFFADFHNETEATIESLEISYLAQQIAARFPGTTDQLTAQITLADGAILALPALSFVATPTQTLPRSEILTTQLDELSIPPGTRFTLSFTATRGDEIEGTVSSEIFLNEFHYDNAGTDTNEFIEVAVAPGFLPTGGDLSQVEIVLYNGNPALLQPYASLPLSDFDNFANPTIENGYRIYSENLSLQNGPDGIAILVAGEVAQFLSYEGAFTATSGPASGLTTNDIGVAQIPALAPGFASLGLTGSGADSSSLNWVRFPQTVPHSPGQLNEGQTFTGVSPASSQAIALDEVRVTILTEIDTDQDGIPDLIDPDDDNDQLPDLVELTIGTNPLMRDSDGNGVPDSQEDSDHDGQSNLAEFLVTETNPADPSSLFFSQLERHPILADTLALTFPTLPNRVYRIMSGKNPGELNVFISLLGTGSEQIFAITPNQPEPTFYRIQVTLSDN